MGYLHAVDRQYPMTAGDDPWETARDGEVWWWDGEQLVLTSPDEAAMVREFDALRRLRDWEGGALTMPATSRARIRTQRHAAWSAILAGLRSTRQRHAPPPAPEDVVQART